MPLRYLDRIVGRLRSEGLKITPQRIAILKFLEGNTGHPSVDEIYREVLRTFPTLSLATVYNTLDTLEKIREVSTVHVDSTRKRFDPNMDPHHHVVCRQCGSIQDLYRDFGPSFAISEDLCPGFLVESASASFRGLCRECSTADTQYPSPGAAAEA